MKRNSYIIQLDSLRAIAVGLVIISHWISNDNLLNLTPNGMMGVTLFFVLSGFLITNILISAKILAEERNQSKFTTLKSFFIRRALRIFPIYFSVIILLYLYNFGLVKQYPLFFLSYTHNYLYYSLNYWPGEISHLWSLAVEEQFYIIWPFIILFMPFKHLLKTIILITVIGLLSHLLFNYYYPHNNLTTVLLPTCFYCFGFGGLLAYLNILKSENFIYKYSSIFFITFLIVFLLSVFNIIQFQKGIFERFIFSIIAFYLIHFFTKFKGIILQIFQNRVLVHIGKVSYGVYLFHTLVNFLYIEIQIYFEKYNLKIPGTEIHFFPNIGHPFIRMFFLSSLLFFCATFSWYLFEKPINNLKKYFVYNK